jgi:anthranilate synthase component 1
VTFTTTLIADALTPVAAYAAARQAAPEEASFLLESVVGGERWGRHTIVGYRARFDASLTSRGWLVRGVNGKTSELQSTADPLGAAAVIFGTGTADAGAAAPSDKLARARFGYFAWDLVHSLDKVEGWSTLPGPLARFVGDLTLVVFDNLEQTVTISAASQADVDQALVDLARAPKLEIFARPDRTRVPADIELGTSEAKFVAAVRRAKEYIAAGDAFQIVLARTFSVPSRGRDPFGVYRAMRVINPSPYMYFLDFPPAPGEKGRTQILGASPETLVRLEGRVMTLRPIAGTRPRGKTAAEDLAFERELTSDPKELAEHVMLIDLGRNDVGRVARVGTVKLVRRMEVERYSHVMHLVSEVQGEVQAGTSPLDVVRAAFPAGTLSGAPKVRAMQIIRELETRPRGVYGGAIGYVTPSGDLDLAIAIRTAVCKDGRFEVTAGAGIVEASVPEREAEETWNKAKSVLSAIESVRARESPPADP